MEMRKQAASIRFFGALIRTYQRVSSWGLPRCRFYPSCSEYMLQAIRSQGAWRGLRTGLIRLLKCHPWHPGGVNLISHGCHGR